MQSEVEKIGNIVLVALNIRPFQLSEAVCLNLKSAAESLNSGSGKYLSAAGSLTSGSGLYGSLASCSDRYVSAASSLNTEQDLSRQEEDVFGLGLKVFSQKTKLFKQIL